MILENNKRIIKNTLILYFRMLLIMGVSLYTVRLVLHILGVVDYGIYNVVAGLVMMFSFLGGTLTTASERFFSYEIGKKDHQALQTVFGATMGIYLLISIVVVIFVQSIGLWFLFHKLEIPQDRLPTVFWVFQFSLMSFIAGMLSIPFKALIIAHENMGFFAYISIFEVVLKLLSVSVLSHIAMDKLFAYSVLMLVAEICIAMCYCLYTLSIHLKWRIDLKFRGYVFLSILKFSGWNMFGAFAAVVNTYGVSILLNVFFGPSVNAARAIALQVSSALNQFVLNFLTALRPQIIKYYAQDMHPEMFSLINRGSKLSFVMLFLVSQSIMLETTFVLSLWLVEVPQYTKLFVQLTLLGMWIDSISYPLMTAAQATGNVRFYQSVTGSVLISNILLAYVMLMIFGDPNFAMISYVIISIVSLFIRLIILKKMINFNIRDFYKEVIIPSIVLLLLSISAIKFISSLIANDTSRFFIVLFTGSAIIIALSYLIILTKNEKKYFSKYIMNKILLIK